MGREQAPGIGLIYAPPPRHSRSQSCRPAAACSRPAECRTGWTGRTGRISQTHLTNQTHQTDQTYRPGDKEPTFMADPRSDRQKAVETALTQIERQFGKGSIMRLGQRQTFALEPIS